MYPYIVTGTITYMAYMSDRSKVTTESRIVFATSEYEAERKFKDFYGDKSNSVVGYYSADDVTALKPIM